MFYITLATILLGLICATHLYGQVVLTELQPVPPVGEPEWIELENVADNWVDVSDWMICDARTCIRLPSGLPRIKGSGRIVLVHDASALAECRTVPDDVLVVEMPLPSLNNSSDVVQIRTADSALVDQVAYSMRQFVRGRSIERSGREFGGKVEFDTLWQACVNADSATCGILNSVVHLPNDLRVAGIRVYDAEIGIDVVNHGLHAAPPTTIKLTIVSASTRKTITTPVPSLLVSEQFEWIVDLATLGWPQEAGAIQTEVSVAFSDDRMQNNTLATMLTLPPTPQSVVITEIMYDAWTPVRDYVEVANSSIDTIVVTGWTLWDRAGNKSTISTLSKLLPKHSIVISSTDDVRSMMNDTAVLAICKPVCDWNITADDVVLRNESGFLVDMVSYSPTWHQPDLPSTKGISLEKLDAILVSSSATSWTSSGALRGGTPGSANSVALTVPDPHAMQAAPSPCSSNRTSPLYPSVISYHVPFRHSILSLSVCNTDGIVQRTLLNSVLSGSEGAVAWDATNNNGSAVQPGIYVVVLVCADLASSNTYRTVCTVVVAE